MANIITGCRIVCSILLLFFPAFSTGFYALYLICGFSDMIDGALARKTGTVSEFGAKFDTASDIIFAAACLIKLLPAMNIPQWLYVWIIVIASIKIINVVLGFICHKRFAAVHTKMNKVAGLLLFALPLTLKFIDIKYSSPFICAAAAFAALLEGYYISAGRHVNIYEGSKPSDKPYH